MIRINSGSKSVLVGTMVPVGSRDEDDYEKGVSHFLEHMLFKGTETRDKYEIKRVIEQYGGQFNAYTSPEHTLYYATIASRYKEVARELIDDMVKNSTIPEVEVEKERNVILEELQSYEDDPGSYIYQLVDRAAFPKGSSLHLPIIGTRESVKALDREVINDYYKRMYQGMVPIEIGDVEDKRTQVILPKRFERAEPIQDFTDSIESREGIHQATMILTGLVPLNGYEDHFRLKMFESVMNGFTGRLFQTIREEHNLVYHCAFFGQRLSCNTFQYYVYAALSPENIEKARTLIQEELTREITAQEIEFAVQKNLGQRDLKCEEKNVLLQDVIGSIETGDNYEEYLTNYENNIRAAAVGLNHFINKSDFSRNKLVALVPEV